MASHRTTLYRADSLSETTSYDAAKRYPFRGPAWWNPQAVALASQLVLEVEAAVEARAVDLRSADNDFDLQRVLNKV